LTLGSRDRPRRESRGARMRGTGMDGDGTTIVLRFIRKASKPRPKRQRVVCHDCGTGLKKFKGKYCGGCRQKRDKVHTRNGRAMRDALVSAIDADRFTPEEIFERDNWSCWMCNLPVLRYGSHLSPMAPQVDHVVPLSRGGRHTRENARCACRRCNLAKGSTHAKNHAETT
jgi:5-methylcytosine-specific restriction endonuclease McrA